MVRQKVGNSHKNVDFNIRVLTVGYSLSIMRARMAGLIFPHYYIVCCDNMTTIKHIFDYVCVCSNQLYYKHSI